MPPRPSARPYLAYSGMTDSRQSELADELERRHPRRITHVRVRAGLTDETRAVEHTQRTRSFLLTAMAVVAAEIERTGRIRLYENGIMSVNLPISTQGRRRAMLAFDAPALADAIARPLQAHLALRYCYREPVRLENQS